MFGTSSIPTSAGLVIKYQVWAANSGFCTAAGIAFLRAVTNGVYFSESNKSNISMIFISVIFSDGGEMHFFSSMHLFVLLSYIWSTQYIGRRV